MINKIKFFKQAGFTLIELLIVIGIVGALAVASIVAINPIGEMQKGTDAKRKSDLAQIQRLLELYYHDTGSYPATLSFGNSWLNYTTKLPNDPKSGKNYAYKTALGNQAYYMYASLDREGNDAQACFPTGAMCTNANGLSCGSGDCNYGVSSSNVTP